MVNAHAQLLVYRFGAEAQFEGQLVGALERAESVEGVRILDLLFVRRDADSGELDAVGGPGGGAGGLVAALVEYRLDPSRRRRATERALRGDHGAVVRELAEQLGVGEALAIVLVDQAWPDALEDVVARSGGTRMGSHSVQVTRLAELGADLPRF